MSDLENGTGGQHNREQTQQNLIEATGRVILRNGFSALGINSIASEAGVSKVLIYRYFGDLNGLLKAYVMSRDYLLSQGLDKLGNSEMPVAQLLKSVISEQIRHLRSNPELQEILRWELVVKNEVTDYVDQIREQQSVAMLEKLKKQYPSAEFDVEVIASLLSSGIYYLVLRSGTTSLFNNINIASDEGWSRIEKTIDSLIDLLLTLVMNGNKK